MTIATINRNILLLLLLLTKKTRVIHDLITRFKSPQKIDAAEETMLVISGPFELWAVWMLKRRLRYKTVARWRRVVYGIVLHTLMG